MTQFISGIDHLCDVLEIPFSEEQRAAITAPVDVPQAIIAGAGSGKTAVMAARVVWLIGHVGVAPAKVLGVTFTRKAAAELRTRVRRSVLQAAELAGIEGIFADGEPTVSTYHSFAADLIAEHGLRRGIDPHAMVIADARRFQLMARAIRSINQTLRHVPTRVSGLVDLVSKLDSQLSDHAVSVEQLRQYDAETMRWLEAEPVVKGGLTASLKAKASETAAVRSELAILVQEFGRLKSEYGVIDFGDQMLFGAQLAQLDEVSATMRERFEVVLLDEYQDTSVTQRDMLAGLFSGPDESHGRGHSMTAVGDPAQGIYGWRGAAASNLLGFLDDFPCRDGSRGTQHTLSVTRRCAHRIIEVANATAHDFYNSTEAVTPLQAAPDNAVGTVTCSRHETISDEIEYLADQVAAAIGSISESGEPIGAGEIAILVRDKKPQARIVDALRARGVETELVGLSGLLDVPEVNDTLALLEVLDDVTANAAVLRLLAGPRFRVGPRDLAKLGQRARDLAREALQRNVGDGFDRALDDIRKGNDDTALHSLCEAVENPGQGPWSPATLERFGQFTAMIRQLRRYATEPLVDLVRRSMIVLGIDIELEVAGLGPENLHVLMDAAAAHEEFGGTTSLAGFLAYLRAESEWSSGLEVHVPVRDDAVKLMTVHRSKGLEFKAVFVPFVVDGGFPSKQSRGNWVEQATVLPIDLRGDRETLVDIEEWSANGLKAFKKAIADDALMEEQRLAYVAFTRAEERLHVSGHLWGPTQVKPRDPSVYLETVASWCRSHGAEPSVWAQDPPDDATNPALVTDPVEWPLRDDAQAEKRRDVAARVHDLVAGPAEITAERDDDDLDQTVLDDLQRQIEVLLERLRLESDPAVKVRLPEALSASDLISLAVDEEAFLARLARPMPTQPSYSATLGTRFHSWVEARSGQQPLIDLFDLPGQGDAGIADDADFEVLREAFESGQFADREPVASEIPFHLVIGGRPITGRIDAVFATHEGFLVVDWKTAHHKRANPLQLAIYRLAWAEMKELPLEAVQSGFYWVRHDELTIEKDLPGRDELEQILR